jgi:hypothetical protein
MFAPNGVGATNWKEGAMRKRALTAIGATALAAAAAMVTSTSAAPAARAAVSAGIVGTWGKTISAATWRRNGISYEPYGHWSIVIGRNGVTSIFTPPGKPGAYPLTTMTVAATGGTVVFGPTADGFCPTKASYRWRVAGRSLALTLAKDSCDARRVLLTADRWAKG